MYPIAMMAIALFTFITIIDSKHNNRLSNLSLKNHNRIDNNIYLNNRDKRSAIEQISAEDDGEENVDKSELSADFIQKELLSNIDFKYLIF
jgi:hypothetical protein